MPIIWGLRIKLSNILFYAIGCILRLVILAQFILLIFLYVLSSFDNIKSHLHFQIDVSLDLFHHHFLVFICFLLHFNTFLLSKFLEVLVLNTLENLSQIIFRFDCKILKARFVKDTFHLFEMIFIVFVVFLTFFY